MQSDLPWNVAGIPPEAREAARAAARREGLSVGEWLTRRILRGLAETGVSNAWWATERTHNEMFSAEPDVDENAEMFARLGRSETESQSAGRCFDEQMRNIVRRLEQAERSQTDNVRAMSRAEAEIDVRGREQALVLERLDARVAHLGERMLHAEQRSQADGTRDAIRTLHQGLSRLADQIAEISKTSNAHMAQLATAVETVAEKLASYRSEHQDGVRALSDRMSAAEIALSNYKAETSLRSNESSELREQSARIAQFSNALDRLTTDTASGEIQHAAAISRLETKVGDLATRIGQSEQERIAATEAFTETLRKVSLRQDSAEKSTREAIAECASVAGQASAGLQQANARIAETDTKLEQIRSEATRAPIPAFDLPPFVLAATESKVDETPPPSPVPAADEQLKVSEPQPDPPAPALDVDHRGPEPVHQSLESFMAAARRTAREAAAAEHSERDSLLSWTSTTNRKDDRQHMRLIVLAVLGLVTAAAVGAALVFGRSSLQTAAGIPGKGSMPVVSKLAPAAGNSRAPRDRLLALANSGNPKAQEVLGLRYVDGDGEAENEAEGAKWLERAAQRGEAVAAYRLGTLYERGHGVPADAAIAAHWYMTAAKEGNRRAMHNLAVAYAEGAGVGKDPVAAAQWFARAADLGLADSQFNLGVLYERGMGVPQSLIDAYRWYEIAAAEGDPESRARVEAIATQLGPEDKAAAEKAAADFHAEAENPAANTPPDAATLSGG